MKDVSAGEDKSEADVVLKVEGMMCPHCEATVKKAIEALDGVNEATADHVSGTVKIVGGKDIPENVYKSVIENEDYEFIGMEKCNDA